MEADVPVIEHGGCVEEDLEEKEGKGRRTQSGYRSRLDPHGEKDLDRMEASTCSEIEIEVRVVHHVESPKDRHSVEHHMLQIDYEIQENDPKGHFHPEGKMV